MKKTYPKPTKFHFVYKITNTINQKFYYGVHSTCNFDDGYFGSGLLIKRAINKYGIQNFEKTIIHVYDNREEAYKKEKEILAEVLTNRNCYNIAKGGEGGDTISFNPNKIEIRKKIRATLNSMSQERKIEISKKRTRKGSDNGMFESARFGELNPMYGKTQSDETRQKISLANKGKPSKRKGKKLTEDEKKNMEGVNSKSWTFLYNGEKVEFVNLKKYSKEHGLNDVCMSRVYRGIFVNHKGYTKYE